MANFLHVSYVCCGLWYAVYMKWVTNTHSFWCASGLHRLALAFSLSYICSEDSLQYCKSQDMPTSPLFWKPRIAFMHFFYIYGNFVFYSPDIYVFWMWDFDIMLYSLNTADSNVYDFFTHRYFDTIFIYDKQTNCMYNVHIGPRYCGHGAFFSACVNLYKRTERLKLPN